MLFVTLVFAAAALLMVGLSIPLILRRVPQNSLYGLRIPATFADESVWYEAASYSVHNMTTPSQLKQPGHLRAKGHCAHEKEPYSAEHLATGSAQGSRHGLDHLPR